jgi:2',3'-cyclic-nucleotide 2'-phosphodiesterase (5'-nucleotidase family)
MRNWLALWRRPTPARSRRCIILHSNDIHGRIEGLARIATLVARTRAEHPDLRVLYFDLGDVEEPSARLSSLTKGVAMYRLLSAAGCDAAAIGNGGLPRYGPQVLPEYAAVARYPLVVANLRLPDGRPLPGAQPTATLDLGTLRLGLVGLTATLEGLYAPFGVCTPPELPLVRELAADLRRDGAGAVLLLSHMGLPDDRRLAAGLQDTVTAIIGAHTHDLLPEGEWVGRVLIAQAGQYAEHLGRLDLLWDGDRLVVERASVLPVTEAIPPAEPVLAEARAIEAEVARSLDEVVGELAEPLDFATDRECGVANLAADVLRARMGAELAVVAAGQAFTGPLPAGPLRRGTLWDVCTSSANPGIATLSGAQLTALVARGLDPAFATERPHVLRGQARGLLHLSGASVRAGRLLVDGQPVELEQAYRVAGTDWELDTFGGYADPSWGLRPTYEVPTIMREAIEAYLAAAGPVRVAMGRVDGPLAPPAEA